MSKTTHGVTFTKPTGVEVAKVLLLEQEDWESNTGKVTVSDMATQFIANLQTMVGSIPATGVAGSTAADTTSPSTSLMSSPVCGVSGGSLKTTIHAYIYRRGKPYTIKTTNGTLTPASIDLNYSVTELVTFSNRDRVDLKYPCHRIVSTTWKNAVYDTARNRVYEPRVSNDVYSLQLTEKVTGVLSVEYVTYRESYSLNATPLADALENVFDTVVYARYSGGVVWLDINVPEGSDDYAKNTIDCGFGSGTNVPGTGANGTYTGSGTGFSHKGDSDKWPPKHPGDTTDKKTYIDYCSQEVKYETIS